MIYLQAAIAIPLGYYSGTVITDLLRMWMYAGEDA